MTQMLTVAEKILYHLFQYIKSEDKYEVPFDITQDGIAQSCGISRAHAAIELKKLRETEQIIEKLSHVKRAKSRRKVYFLTPGGKEKASKIVEHVRVEKLDTGVDAQRIAQGTGPAKRARRHSSAIPQPKLFFGREKELSQIASLIEDDSVEIISLIGLGGTGKTALLSKFARESKASVFWFSFNEWETETSLLKAFGGFLEECGDNRLINYLNSDRIDMGEIGYLLGDALSENRKIIILDDVDKASRLESMLKILLQSSGPNKILMTAETRIGLLDDLKGSGRSVREMALAPLDKDAALELLKTRGISGENASKLCELTGCHAMLLRLVPADDEPTAKMEMTNFVRKTLLKELPAGGMSVVERCSVFRKPFSPNFLARDERNMLKLPIFFQISDSYGMHEIVRKIIIEQLPEAERIEYNSRAADYRLSEGDLAERLYHLVEAGRFLESEILVHSHSTELLSSESPQNLLGEIGRIPPRVSKYNSSVQLLAARASALLGDRQGAVDGLLKIAESASGDSKAEALIELAGGQTDSKLKSQAVSGMEKLLDDKSVSVPLRSRIALSLATIKFDKGDLTGSKKLIERGQSIAAIEFSLDTISSLNRLYGQILLSEGKHSEAISLLGQTAPSFTGKHRAMYHRLLAKAFNGSGRTDEAKNALEVSVRIAEENGLYKELADSLLELSSLKFAGKDVDGAAESCYRCIEVSSSIGDNATLGIAYSNLSDIEEKRGNGKEAEEARSLATKISEEHGAPILSGLPLK